MGASRSIRFAALAVALIVAACNNTSAVSPTGPAGTGSGFTAVPKLASASIAAYSQRPISNRVAVNLAWDAALQRIVLFGGYINGSGSQSNDLWTWDRGNWVRQYPSATPAPDLANAAIGYDGTHKNIVLLTRVGKYEVETWIWDGQTWEQKA